MAADEFLSIRISKEDRKWLELEAMKRTVKAREGAGVATVEVTVSDLVREAIRGMRG